MIIIKLIDSTSVALKFEDIPNVNKNMSIDTNYSIRSLKNILIGCNVEYNTSDVELTTPNYPDDYFPYQDCNQVIRLEEGVQVKLEFIEFQLENPIRVVGDFKTVHHTWYVNVFYHDIF